MRRSRPLLDRLPAGVPAAAAALVVAGLLLLAGVFSRLELLAGDTLRRALAEPLDPRIELVVLDDTSLARAEREFGVRWPWPRETWGQAVRFLRRSGAKAVVLDMLFTSRSSWGEADDEGFAAALREAGGTVAGMQLSAADQPEARRAFAALPRRDLGPASGSGVPPSYGVEPPPEPLWSALAAVGHVRHHLDADGLARDVWVAGALDGRLLPSLALAGLLAAEPGTTARLRPGELELGENRLPLAEGGRMNLLFRRFPDERPATLFEVASSEAAAEEGKPPLVDPARFRGKIVVVGSTVPAHEDVRPTPVSRGGRHAAGLYLHATAIDNLLAGRALRVVSAGTTGALALGALVAALALFAARFPVRLTTPLVIGLVAAFAAAGLVAFGKLDTLLPIATPLAAVAIASAAGAVEHGVREARKRREVESAFGRFLSPAVLTELMGRPLETGGELRELSLLFSDLQGFTSFSEKLGPDRLVAILNLYLDEMGEEIVGATEGYVDKYVGDAIMAFWGAPLPRADHPLAACRAAWRCQRRLERIQPRLAALGLVAGPEGMVMRIGIHTGPAIVGLMGSQRKLSYTAMGDTVNLASRLEGANKVYGSRILISDATRQGAGEAIRARELDLVRVKGKSEPTRVWELIGVAGEEELPFTGEILALWNDGLARFRRGEFPEARARFEEVLARRPGDPPALAYVERCRQYEEAPPDDDWNGVENLTSK